MLTRYVIVGKTVIEGAGSEAEALEIAALASVEWETLGVEGKSVKQLPLRARVWGATNTALGVVGAGAVIVTHVL